MTPSTESYPLVIEGLTGSTMTSDLKTMLGRWFALSAPVDRRFYLQSGLVLMAVRILGDSLILWAAAGSKLFDAMTPLIYIAPTFGLRGALLLDIVESRTPAVVAAVMMGLWALPFMWIGVSMSFRRAQNAGYSPWFGLAFFLPVVNLLVIATLCALPSRPPRAPLVANEDGAKSLLKSAVVAIAYAASFGVLVTVFSVFLLGDYGAALFVAAPTVMGTIGGWRVNRPAYRGFGAAVSVGLMACVLCGGLLIMLALEGIVCLAMVAPLAIALTLLGSVFGALFARRSSSGGGVTAMAIVLPIIGTTDAAFEPEPRVFEMTSEIVVDAPPSDVWPNVIGFSELPEPSDWLLKTGIACPVRARIEGEGVGAVRYCEFTTGPFVEPVTVWDPPHRLGFNVVEQPEPLAEWSPYDEVYSPHLHDTMLSQRGQFELIETESGGTLLRGTTWYTLDLAPSSYWRLWSDMVVHRIHMRVLAHVKQLSESRG